MDTATACIATLNCILIPPDAQAANFSLTVGGLQCKVVLSITYIQTNFEIRTAIALMVAVRI